MELTSEQYQELLDLVKPLTKWLTNNVNPHCKLLVESNAVELVEGVAGMNDLQLK